MLHVHTTNVHASNDDGIYGMDKIFATAASTAVVALVGGLGAYVWLNQADGAYAHCNSSAVAGGSIGGPFEMLDETGETVTDADVITEPALVYFGYTFCPDVCPLDAARNAEAVELLEGQGIQATPVFISIDPERDTPEVLAEYTDYMHPKMIGLTGTPEQVKAASKTYKTYYRRQPGDEEFYLVDHSTFTYLVLPDAGFVDFFRRDATAAEIAEKTACYATS